MQKARSLRGRRLLDMKRSKRSLGLIVGRAQGDLAAESGDGSVIGRVET